MSGLTRGTRSSNGIVDGTSSSSRGGRGGSRGGRGGSRGGNISNRGGRGGVSRVPQSSQRSNYINDSENNESNQQHGKKQSTFFNELKNSPIELLGSEEIRELKLKLINIVSASLIKEPRINQLTPTLESIMSSVYLISYYDPEFVLKLILYTRDELGIRTVANYMICLASLLPTTQPYLKKYFKHLIKIPSDWLELPTILSKLTESNNIPKSLRNVMVDKFSDFDTYQLGKYNTEGKIKRRRKKLKDMIKKNPDQKDELTSKAQANQTASLKNLIRILHISQPVSSVMSILGKKYPLSYEEFVKNKLPGTFEPERAGKRMKLPIPETWETLVSAKGNNSATWEELMQHNKLPFMAMLRNLRNMMITGVPASIHKQIISKLTNEQTIANSKQFPLRFLAAYDSIPKDIEELKLWSSQKKTKIQYYPPSDLLNQYREALDTAVKLSTIHNVKPIRGNTVVFCYVTSNSNSDQCKSNTAGKYSMLESSILLSLMCKYVCEECDLYLVGYKQDETIQTYYKVQEVSNDSILENMKSIKAIISRVFNDNKSFDQPEFPTNVIIEQFLLPKVKVDNILILNHQTVELDIEPSKRNILSKYRQDVNSELLFVNINLSGKTNPSSSSTSESERHQNDIYISGFSDSILKFIAERGGSDQQLQYIEKIDEIKKIQDLLKKPSSSSLSSSSTTKTTTKTTTTNDENKDQISILNQKEKPWRNAKVFISSTFLDMQGERDLLVKTIFPEVRAKCLKHRIHLTEVDLRWGITEEDAKKNRSIDLCLSEVERCSPFFIGLLGERYGWVPNKDQIPLDSKYDWIRNLPTTRSITELEILHACSNKSSVLPLIYIRDSSFNKNIPKQYKDQFDSEDNTSAQKLKDLKIKIETNLNIKQQHYNATWGGLNGDGKPVAGDLDQLNEMIQNDLWNTIVNQFNLNDSSSGNGGGNGNLTTFDPFEYELNQHQIYSDLKCKNFVGRKDEINSLFKFCDIVRPFLSSRVSKLQFNKSNTIVVTGKPGCGKSALVSYFTNKALTEYYQKSKSNKYIIISHYIGSTSDSIDIRKTLVMICNQINIRMGLGEQFNGNIEFSELKITFAQYLKKASLKAQQNGQKVLLLIDGLDQLDKKNRAHTLDWLPIASPVKIIISTLEGDHTLNVLRRRKTPPTEIVIQPMEMKDRYMLVKSKFEDFRKKLDESATNNQMSLLLNKSDANNPLYLVLACEELRYFGQFENLTDKIKGLAPTLSKLFDDILDRLEAEFGKQLIATILGSIACSRIPLFEENLLSILARPEIKGETQYPIALWSRIHRGISSLLVESFEDKSTSDSIERGLEFFHNQLKLAILKRYHSLSDSSTRIHKLLANYYSSKADPNLNKQWDGTDQLAFSELPYHLTKARLFNQLEDTLCNLKFIEKKCKYGLTFELISDYLEITGDELTDKEKNNLNAPSRLIKNKELLEHIKDFCDFVSSNTHILSKSPELTFQQAYNQPNSSYCHKVASQNIYSTSSWIEWSNKPQHKDNCKQTITGLENGATAVAYSRDGSLIASAGKDSIIHIYKSSNGSEVLTLVGHSNWISSFSFSDDNKTLASSSWDETVIIWDLIVGNLIHQFKDHKRAVNYLEFSPTNNNLLMSCAWDSSIIIFNTYDRNIFRIFRSAHSKPVNSCTWSPDGSMIASSAWDGTVKIWNPHDTIAKNRLLYVIDQSLVYGSIKSCKFSSNSKQIYATTMKNDVLLFDIQSQKLVSVIGSHSKSVNHCSLSKDGQYLLTASDDSTIKVWLSQLGKQVSSYHVSNDFWANCLAFHPSKPILAIGATDCTVRLYDVSSTTIYREIAKLHGHTRSITSISFSANGELIASTSEDLSIKVWNISSQKVEYSIDKAHNDPINCISFHPSNSNLLLSCSDDYSSKVWSNGKLTTTLSTEGSTNTIKHCTWSPDGKYIATVSRDCTIGLYLANDSFKLLNRLRGHTDWINFCTFSPDSKKLVSGGWDFNLRVWNVRTQKETLCLKGHTSSIEKAFFTDDQKYIISCSFDGSVKVWDSECGSEITSLYHSSRISDVIKSTDNSGRIFSSSDDGIIKSWYPVSGSCLATFAGHSNSVNMIDIKPSSNSNSSFSSFSSFSSSSSTTNQSTSLSFASASSDGTVKLWDFNSSKNTISAHKGSINKCSYSKCGLFIVTGGQDSVLNIWDAKTLVNLKTMLYDSPVTAVTFDPQGLLFCGLQNGQFKIYDKSWNTIIYQGQSNGKISHVSSSVNNMFGYSSWDNVVTIVNVENKTTVPLIEFDDWVECVEFSKTGQLSAAGSRTDQLVVYHPTTGKYPYTNSSSYTTALSFSLDDQTLAIGSFDGSVQLLNSITNKFERILTTQTSSITGLKFLDSNRLVSVSTDRSLIVWNFKLSTIENEFIHNSPITSLDINQNNIITSDTNGNIYLLKYHKSN